MHQEVIEMVISFVLDNGFRVLNLDYSPVKGPEGNIEYLLHIQKDEALEFDFGKIKLVVDAAHADLD